MSKAENQENRIIFLDYLRLFIVLIVVIHHSLLSYLASGNYQWLIMDKDNSLVFDILARFDDMYMMPTLFFISGYFTLPSSQKKGYKNFLINRLSRLGIPFFFGIIFINSVTLYIRHVAQEGYLENYFNYWIYEYFPKDISARHLWFLNCLFIITVLVSTLNNTKPQLLNSIFAVLFKEIDKPLIIHFMKFGFLTSIMFFVVNLIWEDQLWITIIGDGVLRFQPTRLVFYISYFILGFIAYKHSWKFNEGSLSQQNLKFWSIFSILLIIGQLIYIYLAYVLFIDHPVMNIINAILHGYLCLSVIITLIIIFSGNLFQKRSNWLEKLSSDSYGIYVGHLPIVVLFQYWITKFSLSPYFKFVIVSTFSLFLSVLFSRYFLKKLPVLKNCL
jgi:peptidoglycan/LPS O-acetylase OafA/YrhL